MAIRTKGSQQPQSPQQASAQPGIRFIVLLVVVCCVGACIWGVLANFQDSHACKSYFQGLELKRQGKYDEANRLFQEAERTMGFAIESRKKQNSDFDATVANDITNLGRCQVELGKTDEALKKFKESEALFEKLNAQRNIDYIGVLSYHGDLLMANQRCEEAQQIYQKILDTLEKTKSTDRLAWSYTYERLRRVYVKLGKPTEAQACEEAAKKYALASAYK